MKGNIRAVVGFLMVYGAVGTLEFDNNASLVGMMALGLVGAGIMWSGVQAFRKNS